MTRMHPELAAWLARQEAGFPAWAEETGTPERWDFSPASLDTLEALVRERYADEHAFADAVREGTLLQVAGWYVGETIRRARGCTWQHCGTDPSGVPGFPGSGGTWEPLIARDAARDGPRLSHWRPCSPFSSSPTRTKTMTTPRGVCRCATSWTCGESCTAAGDSRASAIRVVVTESATGVMALLRILFVLWEADVGLHHSCSEGCE